MDAGRSAVATWRAAPSTDNAQAVIDALASIAEPLRPHLDEEETVVLPIATKWISPEEWGRLPGHHMMSFRGDKPWLPMGLVREQLDQEHRDGMLAGMPPEMRTMWTEQMEPAFNAFIRRSASVDLRTDRQPLRAVRVLFEQDRDALAASDPADRFAEQAGHRHDLDLGREHAGWVSTVSVMNSRSIGLSSRRSFAAAGEQPVGHGIAYTDGRPARCRRGPRRPACRPRS